MAGIEKVHAVECPREQAAPLLGPNGVALALCGAGGVWACAVCEGEVVGQMQRATDRRGARGRKRAGKGECGHNERGGNWIAECRVSRKRRVGARGQLPLF